MNNNKRTAETAISAISSMRSQQTNTYHFNKLTKAAKTNNMDSNPPTANKRMSEQDRWQRYIRKHRSGS